MILIITHKEDYTTDYVIDKLNKKSIPYFRFNCEDYLSYDIFIEYNFKNIISINNINKFTSVWYRRTKLPTIDCENQSERIYLLNEMDTFMHNLFEIIDAKWLSNPISVAAAENKLAQLRLAKELGMNVPTSLITNNISQLKCFINKNSKTIIKPIARGRIDYADNSSKLIFTNIIPEDVINQIDSYTLTPAIYQEYIEKEYELRVTVVEDEIFAASVDSQSFNEAQIDWRRKKMKFEKYNLPEALKNKCRMMLKHLNLSFGAFDFIKATNGDYYFLEVNPNGQWVWIEKDTGLPISESIIKFLSC
jgi:glutathione synthase/RimK-type ligase-like ATP-grasp enzyme